VGYFVKSINKGNKKMKVLLGITGGVASKLSLKMIKALQQKGHEVKVIATEKSFYFWNPSETEVEVFSDQDEWSGDKYTKDMPIAHIELRKWADVVIIAPVTANTLAKIANGMADNLLTCVMRAWETKTKPIVIAPAMNTAMWEHPATQEHLEKISRWYRATIIEPVSKKKLACGDTGKGAMAHIDDIVNAL
jgi:phosphopantothenoylcysteine decarboxylase